MTARDRYAHGEFAWVDLSAHDMTAASRFYKEVFGWTATLQDTKGGPPYAEFRIDDAAVAGLGQMPDTMKSQGIPPMWNSYVHVEDVGAIVDRAPELGGKVTVPVTRVMDAGHLAFVQDPTGGHLGLWQAERHQGAGRVNEPGAFCWNELATRDLEGAQSFYGALLGWTFRVHEQSPSPYRIIERPDADGEKHDNGGIILMTEQWGDVPPHWAVYFAVSDVRELAAHVRDLGGKVHAEPFETPVGTMAVLADPQGAVFHAIQLTAAMG